MAPETSQLCNIDSKIDNYIKNHNIKTRPNASHGSWMTFLLPVCLSICILRHATSQLFCFIFIQALTLSLITCIIILTINKKNHLKKYATIIPSLAAMLFCVIFFKHNILLSVISSSVICFSLKHGLKYILKNCPLCFTFGEAAFIIQSIILFTICTIINVTKSFNTVPELDHDIITLILQLGMISVFLVVLTLLLIRSIMSLNKFISVVSIYIIGMLFTLHILLQRSPVLWIIMYIFDNQQRLMMIGYWVMASIIGVAAVTMQMSSGNKASTSRRKIFHLLSAAVYIPGIIYECNLIYLASGIALAAIIALETIRKSNIGWFSNTLNDGFQVFADEKDVGGISMTPIYLLLGISGPIFLHPLPCTAVLPLLSGILSVGIGDTAASYIGSRYGRKKWPGTAKSYHGTIANVVSQLFTLFILFKCGFLEVNNLIIILCAIAVVVNSTVEALTDQVDNLTLPIITFSILSLA